MKAQTKSTVPKEPKRRKTALERFVERVDAGESAWSDDDVEVEVEVSPALKVVVPVRMPPDKYTELARQARELGIGPSTLMRMWTLEKLRGLKRSRKRPASARPPART